MSDPVPPSGEPGNTPFKPKPVTRAAETPTFWRCAACKTSTPHHRIYCDRCGASR